MLKVVKDCSNASWLESKVNKCGSSFLDEPHVLASTLTSEEIIKYPYIKSSVFTVICFSSTISIETLHWARGIVSETMLIKARNTILRAIARMEAKPAHRSSAQVSAGSLLRILEFLQAGIQLHNSDCDVLDREGSHVDEFSGGKSARIIA